MIQMAEKCDLSGVWTGRAIQRSALGKADAGLAVRLSILAIGRSKGRAGSGMVGPDVGLTVRLSVLLCMRELLTGLSSDSSGRGSEKGFNDAVRI